MNARQVIWLIKTLLNRFLFILFNLPKDWAYGYKWRSNKRRSW